jgi:hypothetical protein
MTGLAAFLRETVSPEEARRRIQEQLARRESSFLDVIDRGIYANPESPYSKLLEYAGIAMSDIAGLVQEAGLEGALSRLYDAGVYLTLEEVRGRAPVRRGNLEFFIGETDLDNPLLETYFEGVSSGSRSAGRRVFIDFRRLEYEAFHVSQMLEAHGLGGRPLALWRPVPPDSTGLNNLFRYTKIGGRLERWFSQSAPGLTKQGPRPTLLLYSTLLTGRLARRPLQRPRFVPRNEAVEVARWLAETRSRGTPGVIDTSASCASRVCQEALNHGLDISGSAFVVAGEPYTPAKASVISAAGARGLDRYSLTEVGSVGFACANPIAVDDMHFAGEKVAVIQRQKVMNDSGDSVPGLVYTTLLPTASSLMLNTESGDYGEIDDRGCGCLLEHIGLKTHLTGLGSYEKLTSEGVSFMRNELYALIEEVLPALYGGHGTDYQLVEEEDQGLTRVSIIVSPEVGEVDEQSLVSTVLQTLDRYFEGGPRMANEWRRGETLRVVRREPFASGSRKILPLHVMPGSKAEPRAAAMENGGRQ